MKKKTIFMLLSIMLLVFCVARLSYISKAQTNRNKQLEAAASQKKATELVRFFETEHDFGKIKYGVPVTYDFVFENVGNLPAIIEYAKASCGCTTPMWPKIPVMKTKKGKISAGFNAAMPGQFDKTIFVKVANYDQSLELHITGEVLSNEDYAKYKATASSRK